MGKLYEEDLMNNSIKLLSAVFLLSTVTTTNAGGVTSGVSGISGGSQSGGNVTSGIGSQRSTSSNDGNASKSDKNKESSNSNTLGESPTDSNNPKNPNNLDNSVPNAVQPASDD